MRKIIKYICILLIIEFVVLILFSGVINSFDTTLDVSKLVINIDETKGNVYFSKNKKNIMLDNEGNYLYEYTITKTDWNEESVSFFNDNLVNEKNIERTINLDLKDNLPDAFACEGNIIKVSIQRHKNNWFDGYTCKQTYYYYDIPLFDYYDQYSNKEIIERFNSDYQYTLNFNRIISIVMLSVSCLIYIGSIVHIEFKRWKEGE